MPAKSPAITDDVADLAVVMGKRIRAQRKSLRVSATTAAQAAGMSRVTWYRLENGNPSVTMGAYLSAINVLGLECKVVLSTASNHISPPDIPAGENFIPVHIDLAEYPQLKQLAWQVHGVDKLRPKEALDIYERNWRHLDLNTMEERERHLVNALRLIFADEVSDV